MFTLKFNRPASGDVERPKVCQIHMGKSKENLRSKDKKKKNSIKLIDLLKRKSKEYKEENYMRSIKISV